ncbi:Sensor histidine kinase TodS [Pseudooceanicola marinus]|uniref:histidine kinase n=1 Tax=Pseudooceanicola marinus TaxID=396013 RepID=A0A1X6YYA4_9RHOB|nr:ATP-binding protein [Pseudooceanicola marinus]PJE32604.1 histidine kinase [Pseudooceanicola marinus]SLN35232.1 Sensor histidine kinase TodS [Pseudooceanicola marinus]
MKKTLGAPLFLGLAGLQLLAVLAIVFSSYITSEGVLMFHARNLLRNVGLNTMEHSRGFLKPAHDAAELAVRLAQNRIVASDDPDRLEQLLFQQLQLTTQASGMYFGAADGSFVFVMRDPGTELFRTKFITYDDSGNRETRLIWRTEDFNPVREVKDPTDTYDPRNRSWFTGASETGGMTWADPYIFFSSRQPGITLAAPVFSEADSVGGVIGVDIEIDEISDFLMRLKIGRSGRAVIINRNGDVIAGQAPDLLKTTAADGSLRFVKIDEFGDPIARQAFAPLFAGGTGDVTEEVTTTFTHDGRRFVALAMPILSEALPWTIGVYAPEDDFIAEIKQNRLINIWIAVAVAAVTGGIGLALANSIHRPVRAFAVRSALINQGEVDPDEPAPRTYRELEAVNDALMTQIAARRRAEREYGLTFEMSSRGMAQIEPGTGRFIRVNNRLCDITGYDAGQLTSKTLSELVLPSDRNALPRDEAMAESDFSTNQELRLRRADGVVIWVRLNAIMIRDGSGAALHAVMTLEDVTLAHEKESEIVELNREMTLLARDNTMGQLAAGLAHELNQPLAVIAQNAGTALYMLQKQPGVAPELVEAMFEVEGQALRAGEIINALRGLIHNDGSASAPFALGPLLDQVQRLVQHEAGEAGVRLIAQDAAGIEVRAHRVQIAQVLVNLLTNAIEAFAQADPATLPLPNDRQVRITLAGGAGQLTLGVVDNGPGVGQGVQLFTQFETTKPDGLGLGLSICRSIVRANGGKLWHEPVPDGGAAFYLTLPLAEAAGTDGDDAETTKESPE